MLWDIGLIMVIVGLILLVISLILVFALKIPDLLDELSGRKAKRQIKRLKELNIGTGSLEGIATDDFYSSLSSGNLITEEYKAVSKDLKKDEEIEEVEKNVLSKNVIPSSDDEEEAKTGYMDDSEEQPTGFIGDDDVTGILNDVNECIENRHTIDIIEEQTSIY